MSWRARLIAVALFVIAFCDLALACQCGGERPVTKARAEAAFVVTGLIRALHPAIVGGARLKEAGSFPLPRVWPVSVVEVGVTRSITGAAPPTIELTHIGCCVCEADLEVGHEYLLFVLPSYEVRDAYMVSRCYPNRKIEVAGPLLRQLPVGTAYGSANLKTSTLSWVKWRFQALANTLARGYVKRIRVSPFTDPLLRVKDSPWTPFLGWLTAGAIVGIAVVVLLRATRT